MLELRPTCECCGRALANGDRDARICTYECTFCAACANGPLGGRCPNCGGDLVPRPTRPADRLARDPASTRRVEKAHPGCAGAAPGARGTRLVVLGSGGWIPTALRETSAALLVQGEEAILLDAGTGVRRLLASPGLLAGVRRLTVVLTHYHLDHTIGLAYLPGVRALTGVQVEAVGPGRRAYGEPAEAVLARLLGPPLFASGPARVIGAVHDLPDGPLVRGGLVLDHRLQRLHPQPTVAYRLGDALAWCTDTAADRETPAFARGVRHLYHEGMARPGAGDATHTTPAEAARIAREAGAGALVLIHVDPLRPDAEAEAEAQAVLPGARVARDLELVDLDAGG